jgi:hypothetical protein
MSIIKVTKADKKKDINKFVDLPWEIYKDDPNWVPPLKIAVKDFFKPKHPFFDVGEVELFLAYRENKIVGRIAAIINTAHNKFWNDRIGFWGFYESIDDKAVSKALIETAESWLKDKGMTSFRGPVNPSTNYECGLLFDGLQDSPQIMMTYNPEYYSKHFSSLGYEKVKDLLAYQIDLSFKMPEKITRIAARIEKSKKVTYRFINKKNWDNEVQLMLKIYNKAWQKNWGFIPMTEKEFIHTANDLKSVVDENLIMYVLVDGKESGFIVCLPDFNQVFKKIPTGKLLPTGIFKLLRAKKYINRVRVITLGVVEECRRMGLETLLYQKMHEQLKINKFEEAEMSWILEDNLNMNKPLLTMGAKPYKTYRIYEKSLTTP